MLFSLFNQWILNKSTKIINLPPPPLNVKHTKPGIQHATIAVRSSVRQTQTSVPHTRPRSPNVLDLKGGSNIPGSASPVRVQNQCSSWATRNLAACFRPLSKVHLILKITNPHPVATVTAFEVNYNSIRKVLFLTSCFDQRQTRANKRTNKVCHNQSEKFYFLFFCEGENPPSVRRPLQALLLVAAGPGEW